MKSKKGITLVALVITIIVLLILAGVSISLVVGDNGVLTQASTASEKSAVAQAEEAVEQAIAGLQGKFSTNVWPTNTTQGFITNYLTDALLDTEIGSANNTKYSPTYVQNATNKNTGTVTITVNGVSYKATLTEATNKIGATISDWSKV